MLKKHLLNYQESCNHCSIGYLRWLAMLEQVSRQWVQMKQPKNQTLVKDGIIIKCWFHKKTENTIEMYNYQEVQSPDWFQAMAIYGLCFLSQQQATSSNHQWFETSLCLLQLVRNQALLDGRAIRQRSLLDPKMVKTCQNPTATTKTKQWAKRARESHSLQIIRSTDDPRQRVLGRSCKLKRLSKMSGQNVWLKLQKRKTC